jgi:hypothetical protein
VLDDLHHLRAEARRAIDQGRPEQAEASLLAAAGETHVADDDYVTVLEPLADLMARRGDVRGALTIRWYLAGREQAPFSGCLPLLPHVSPADRGRTLAAMGNLSEAAREMESAGQLAAAAIYREQAEDWQGARAIWSRLAQTGLRTSGAKGAGGGAAPRSEVDTYSAALVQCNLARCARRCGDASQAHDAIVVAVRLLEEAADHFEAIGLRERAFDCFQVLIQLGREHGTFEDIVEGFVNCIRILREDHLKTFALQFLDDAIGLAKETRELSAAATLALEASQYARATGNPAEATYYTRLQAELWRDAAHQHLTRGDSPEIAENALLAAVVAFGEVGQFARVGELYVELGSLDLPEARREHYARAARRYESVRDDVATTGPRRARGRQDAGAPEVWHVDLLEWEQDGSAAECCAEVLLGKAWPALTKRKALLARLTALQVEGAADDATPEHVGALVRLADQLAQMQLYVVLSPLERLWRSRHRAVRLAVLSALQRLFFKRTFVTLRGALNDPDQGLRDHASSAMEALHFPEAFDPLSRVVRESTNPRARASAIAALAQIDTVEAAEFLLGVLAHGAPPDCAAASRSLRDALRETRHTSFATLARQEIPTSPPALQAALRDIVGQA